MQSCRLLQPVRALWRGLGTSLWLVTNPVWNPLSRTLELNSHCWGVVNALNSAHFRSAASVFDILLISCIWFAVQLKLLSDINLLNQENQIKKNVWTVDCIFKYEQTLVQPQSMVHTALCLSHVIRATFWSPFWGLSGQPYWSPSGSIFRYLSPDDIQMIHHDRTEGSQAQ